MKIFPHTRTRNVQFGFKGMGPNASSELVDPAYASDACNFVFEDGCLTGNIGIDPASFLTSEKAIPDAPEKIEGLYYYKHSTKEGARDDRLIMKAASKEVYSLKLLEESEWQKVPNLKLTGKDVQAINYNFNDNDMILFCSYDTPLFILDDMTPLYSASAPHFSCFEIHSERLFGGVNGARPKLWFSDDYDPFNWKVSAEEAGYIAFDDNFGDILKVMSFLGYLYIFREYGIFRLTAFGKQSEFSLKRVYADTERIFKNSIAFTGGRIIFIAGGKLYDFDGYNVRRIATNLPEIDETDDMSATYQGGIYWLSCRFKGSEGMRIVRYEPAKDAFSYITGVEAADLLTVKTGGMERVYLAFKDADNAVKLGIMSESGMIMGKPSKKEYKYEPSTLGTANQKTVRRVSVVAYEPLTLTVIADDREFSFDVKASEFVQRFFVDAKGRKIGLALASDKTKAYVAPITMEIEVHAD